MRNIFILLLLSALFTSCATRKYGCGLTTTSFIGINPNYVAPKQHLCRGNGTVQKNSDGSVAIKIDGALIKDDTDIADTKFVLVYGSFAKVLTQYAGQNVKFECKAVFPKEEQVLYVVGGCVENDGITENSIVNSKWTNR